MKNYNFYLLPIIGGLLSAAIIVWNLHYHKTIGEMKKKNEIKNNNENEVKNDNENKV